MNCLNCNKETTNPKFCSKSCATIYNNKKIGARHNKPEKYICPICKGKKTKEAKLCKKCYNDNYIKEVMDKPISDFICRKNGPYKYNAIRTWAKRLMKYWNVPYECLICGYPKNLDDYAKNKIKIDVAHLRPINDFCNTDLLGEVNSKNNIVYLCKRCHVEFDLLGFGWIMNKKTLNYMKIIDPVG